MHVTVIRKLESVQIRFSQVAFPVSHIPYHNRLVPLGLDSFEPKRFRTDLVCVYKIMLDVVAIDSISLFNL